MSKRHCLLIYGARVRQELVAEIREIAEQTECSVRSWTELGGTTNTPQVEEIRAAIASSQRVVAILDEPPGALNPNVLYEVGFTHGLVHGRAGQGSKLVSLVHRGLDLPFNLALYNHVQHDGDRLDGPERERLRRLIDTTPTETLRVHRERLRNLELRVSLPHEKSLVLRVAQAGLEISENGVRSRLGDGWTDFLPAFFEVVERIERLARKSLRAASGVRGEFGESLRMQLAKALDALDELLADHPTPETITKGVEQAARRIELLEGRLSSAQVTARDAWRRSGLAAVGAITAGLLWCLLVAVLGQRLGWLPIPDRYAFPENLMIGLGLVLPAIAGGLARPLGWLRGSALLVGLTLTGAGILNAERISELWEDPGSWWAWQPVLRSTFLMLFLGVLVARVRGPRSPFRLSLGYHVGWVVSVSLAVFMMVILLEVLLPGLPVGSVDTGPNWSSIACRASLTILIYVFVRGFLKTPWVVPLVRTPRVAGST